MSVPITTIDEYITQYGTRTHHLLIAELIRLIPESAETEQMKAITAELARLDAGLTSALCHHVNTSPTKPRFNA